MLYKDIFELVFFLFSKNVFSCHPLYFQSCIKVNSRHLNRNLENLSSRRAFALHCSINFNLDYRTILILERCEAK